MEGKRKKFYKNLISNCIFFNNVTFIETSYPALCRQKEFVLNLKVAHKCRSFINPFPVNHARLFPIAASFPALSILTISVDKCQSKSSENVNILIKVILF